VLVRFFERLANRIANAFPFDWTAASVGRGARSIA
jgi:hypothetical protein